MSFSESLCIEQIVLQARFLELEAGITTVLSAFRALLLDDYQMRHEPDCLTENVKSYVPLLWVIREGHNHNEILGIAALSEVMIGRHAFLHGVSVPSIRRHPAISQAAALAIDFAFNELQVLKVKVEFRASNRGVRGFCRRMGFRQEAVFKEDILVNGSLQDVIIASLNKAHWEERLMKR